MGPKFPDSLSDGLDMDTDEGKESYWGRLADWEATHNDEDFIENEDGTYTYVGDDD